MLCPGYGYSSILTQLFATRNCSTGVHPYYDYYQHHLVQADVLCKQRPFSNS